MITYNDYLTEANEMTLVFTFGRFNPPTIGHGKLIEAVVNEGKKHSNVNIKIFASQTQDAKKNPLNHKQKISFLKKMFPKYKKYFMTDANIKTPFDVIENIGHYEHTVMVVGSDRVDEFKKRMHPYVKTGVTFEVVSAGERDPDAEGVSGMSASKMRQAVSDDDFESFEQGSPMKKGTAQQMFNAVKKGMKL